MSQETAFRKQRAVLWVASGKDNYGGVTMAAPVQINVRWEPSRGETRSPTGATITWDARVHVNREIPVRSEMWLGTLAEYLQLATAPTRFVVVDYVEASDIKNVAIRREVKLMRLSDAAPVLS